MTPLETIGLGWILVAAIMGVLWWVHVRIEDAGIVDVGWTLNLAVLAILYAALLDTGLEARRWLVAGVVTLWSVRLGAYLFADRIRSEHEDGRYISLRERWGRRFRLYMVPFFQAQGFLDVVLSIAFLLAMVHPAPALRVWDALGVALILVSIAGETISDLQLARWRANPAHLGRTCRIGLWRYSRHPNYFFEWLHWIGYVVMAWGAPWWWATWFAPLLMYVFIRFVTGIPPTEHQALKSRGEDYRRYQREVNALIPWFPRRDVA